MSNDEEILAKIESMSKQLSECTSLRWQWMIVDSKILVRVDRMSGETWMESGLKWVKLLEEKP